METVPSAVAATPEAEAQPAIREGDAALGEPENRLGIIPRRYFTTMV